MYTYVILWNNEDYTVVTHETKYTPVEFDAIVAENPMIDALKELGFVPVNGVILDAENRGAGEIVDGRFFDSWEDMPETDDED